jgi:hypothetical protein
MKYELFYVNFTEFFDYVCYINPLRTLYLVFLFFIVVNYVISFIVYLHSLIQKHWQNIVLIKVFCQAVSG